MNSPSSLNEVLGLPIRGWQEPLVSCNDVHNVAGKLCMQGIANHDSNA